MLKNKKVLIVAAFAVVIILTSTAFSFTASNTVPGSRLGEGANTISGYEVTDIDYVSSDTYPSTLNAVVLTLDNSAEWVKISLDAAAPHTFYTCTFSSGTTWSCDTSAAGAGSVLAAANLVVVAGD